MPQIVFAPFRIRVPQQYLVGEESPGLKAFRRLLPPFVHVEVVQPGTPEYDDLRVHSVSLEAGENFNGNVIEYMSRLIDDRMGQATKEFYTSTAWRSGDSITRDADGKKLGIQMIKAMIAETIEVAECRLRQWSHKGLCDRSRHPPQLEDELQCHLSALPVPAISASRSERLISIAAGQEMRHFVVEPYSRQDLTRRRSTDPDG